MIADKDYGLTADGRAVVQTDPASVAVLVGKGCFIPDEEAKRLDIMQVEETVTAAEVIADIRFSEQQARARGMVVEAEGKKPWAVEEVGVRGEDVGVKEEEPDADGKAIAGPPENKAVAQPITEKPRRPGGRR